MATDFAAKLAQCRGPLTMTGPMVLAVREGREGETWCVCNPQPRLTLEGLILDTKGKAFVRLCRGVMYTDGQLLAGYAKEFARFAPGDLAYVAEGVQIIHPEHSKQSVYARYLAGGFDTGLVRLTDHEWGLFRNRKRPFVGTPSRFMYKSFARTIIRIGGVEAVQVQDIDDAGVRAEGVRSDVYPDINPCKDEPRSARIGFMDLWDSIHPKPPLDWASNPFCWRYYGLTVEATR